jgi:hypothetical protein
LLIFYAILNIEMEEIYMTDYKKTKAFLDDIGIPYIESILEGAEDHGQDFWRNNYLAIDLADRVSPITARKKSYPITFLFSESGKLVEFGDWL